MRSARLLLPPILLAVAGLVAARPARAELIWTVGTADELLETARARDLPAVLVFHAEWCGFCRRLEKETLASPLVQKSRSDFIAGRIDVDLPEGSAAANRWSITGLPAILILAPDGRIAASLVGFRTDQQLALELRDALAGQIPLEERLARANLPGSPVDRKVEAARALLETGRIDEAQALLEQSLGLLPARSAETARARVLLATAFSRRSGTEAALAELDRAVEATDDPVALTEAFTLRISLLRSLVSGEDPPVAERDDRADPAKLADPENRADSTKLADRDRARAELVRTWRAFADRLDSDPTVQEDCVRGLEELGVAPEIVLAQANRALALNSESAGASGARARALYTMGRDEEALTAINRAIQLDPLEQTWRVLRLKILDRLQAGKKQRS